MSKIDNGPDRSLGTWKGEFLWRYEVRAGELWTIPFERNYNAFRSEHYDVSSLLRKSVPIDTTAKREAIRAGWRELNGKWVKDERLPWSDCFCKVGPCAPNPRCYEAAAIARREWPFSDSTPTKQSEAKPPEENNPAQKSESEVSKILTLLNDVKTEDLHEALDVLIEWKTKKEQEEAKNLLESVKKQLVQKLGIDNDKLWQVENIKTNGEVFRISSLSSGSWVGDEVTYLGNDERYFRVVGETVEEVKPVITWEVV